MFAPVPTTVAETKGAARRAAWVPVCDGAVMWTIPARAKARADAKPKRPLPKMTDAQVDRLKEPTLLTDILDQKLVRAMRARERDMLTMKPTHKGQSPLWVGHRHPTTPLA